MKADESGAALQSDMRPDGDVSRRAWGDVDVWVAQPAQCVLFLVLQRVKNFDLGCLTV